MIDNRPPHLPAAPRLCPSGCVCPLWCSRSSRRSPCCSRPTRPSPKRRRAPRARKPHRPRPGRRPCPRRRRPNPRRRRPPARRAPRLGHHRNDDRPGARSARAAPAAAHRRPRSQRRLGGSHAGRSASPTSTPAVSPSSLTPPLPSTLGGSISGVPTSSSTASPSRRSCCRSTKPRATLRDPLAGARRDQRGRDRLRPRPERLHAGRRGLDAVHAEHMDALRSRRRGDGFPDPYNPADAIFAAARYLARRRRSTTSRRRSSPTTTRGLRPVGAAARAPAGRHPAALLGAITGLTEARFPVYAAAHYSDGFPSTEGASSGASPHTVPGTTIYTQANAPAIAVQDGRVVQILHSGPLGASVSLKDAYGNTYTYAELGTLSTLSWCSKRLNRTHSPARPPVRARARYRAPRPARAPPSARRAGAIRAFRAGSRTSTCTRCTSAPR